MSKYQPVDLSKNCRVYFFFVSNDGSRVNTYYDRPQFLSDNVITKEALKNAEDMKRKFQLKDLISIYIARTN